MSRTGPAQGRASKPPPQTKAEPQGEDRSATAPASERGSTDEAIAAAAPSASMPDRQPQGGPTPKRETDPVATPPVPQRAGEHEDTAAVPAAISPEQTDRIPKLRSPVPGR